MLDLVGLLDPAGGLIRAHSIESPTAGGDGMWRVVARLECAHASDEPSNELQTCVTGACSVSRADAMVRAAGESVERIALHGEPGVVATEAEMGERALRFREAGRELAAPPPETPLLWYSGRRVRDDAELMVPAGLVDYPADVGSGFDPGPSGAAAGIGPEAALRGALLETIERDALITSWARRVQTRRVDIDAFLESVESHDPARRRVVRVRDLMREAGLVPEAAEVPLSVPQVVCVVGGVRIPTPTGEALCLGANVSDDPARAIAGALEESMQLYPVLQAARDRRNGKRPPTVVAGENDRLDFLASAEGAASVEDWLSDQAPACLPTALPAVSTQDLMAAVIADGLDPVVLDLSHRLPSRARRMGWSVVKVVPVGYQPLRVDERTEFGWNEHRLATVADRTGMPARLPPGKRIPDPHPLP